MLALMDRLALDPQEREVFGWSLLKGGAGRSVVVLTELAPEGWVPGFVTKEEVPDWLPRGIYPVSDEKKAGKEKGFEEGWFYPLDMSSVWESMALGVVDYPVRRFLDMCSAPGGKSILTHSRLHPGEHFANEVEASRVKILRHNLKRCGYRENVYTQRLMPRVWAELAPECFDLIWVDAPCSGQSLLAKGVSNPGCFYPATVKGNAKRQKGILAAAIDCLSPGGMVAYSTCSFSWEENEQVAAWVLKKFPEMRLMEIPVLKQWRTSLNEHFCYRLMPQHKLGAGGFVAIYKKQGEIPCDLPEPDARLREYPV